MQDELTQYILNYKQDHYRLAYSYVKNQQDALDVVQDAIVKAIRAEHTLKNKDLIHSWFCKIIINTAKTHLLKAKKYVDCLDSELECYQAPSYDSTPDFEVKELLQDLSTNEKTIIILRYFEQLDLNEVASVMNQNLSTVKSTLYRSLRKLRKQLDFNKREIHYE